jgi:hypothetical protein
MTTTQQLYARFAGGSGYSPWPTLGEAEPAYNPEPAVCAVCKEPCSRITRCMECHAWVHVRCTHNGVCDEAHHG